MLRVICGPPHSGKSETLTSKLLQQRALNKRIRILVPAVTSHEKSPGVKIMERALALPAIPVGNKMDCLCVTRKSKANVIGIDDCHLFEGKPWFLEAIRELLSNDPRNPKDLIIILAGTDNYNPKKQTLMRELRKISKLSIDLPAI